MTALRDRILAYFQAESPHPLKLRDLAKTLQVSDEDYGELRRTVRQLEQEGGLVKLRNNRYGPPERLNLAVGRLSVNPGGFGFVSREAGGEDVFVGAREMGAALHGDRVVVRLRERQAGQQEGEVIRVLERALNRVVGVYRQDRRFGYVTPDDKRITRDITVAPEDALDAKPGETVVARIERWESGHLNPEGRIVEVLGDPDAPGVDILSIIKAYGLPLNFPDHVLHLTDAFSDALSEGELRGRTDLRETVCFTVDPEDAKDFDDAVSLDPQPDGTLLLGVHIADVSHYVREGTPLDHEARIRGTSVYLVDRVIPMLPERLSNALCSLRPGEDRLTMSVLARLDGEGNLLDHRIVESVIRSAARLTYEQVQEVLDEEELRITNYELRIEERKIRHSTFDIRHSLHSEIAEGVRSRLVAMEALRRKLTARRLARGALDFDLPEAKVILDARGAPVDVRRYERRDSHRLIEEFMLLANEVVARHLHDWGVPTLYRVHDQPDRAKLEAFAGVVESFGHRFPVKEVVHPVQITRFLEGIRGKRAADVINDLLLRSMKKALYTPHNIGHFGLACEFYTHFTSPIRRYPDLVVHRILRETMRGEMAERRREALSARLPAVGEHATEREVAAQEAERESVKVKQVQFMEGRVGEAFDGLIVSVRPAGMFVQIGDYLIDGFIRVSAIDDDYYLFEERMRALIGERTGRTFRLGDRVRVRVVRADRALRQVDLLLEEAGGDEAGGEGRRAKGERRRAKGGRQARRPLKSYRRRGAVKRQGRY